MKDNKVWMLQVWTKEMPILPQIFLYHYEVHAQEKLKALQMAAEKLHITIQYSILPEIVK